MILSVGEVTQDIFLNDEEGRFEIKVGGAPFNLAAALKKLGAKAGFYGCVGGDGFCGEIRRKAESFGLDFLKLDTEQKTNTPTVLIRSRKDDVEFTSFVKKTSDKYLKYSSVKDVVKNCDIIHFGSLMFADAAGRRFAYKTIRRAREHGCRVSFDANMRDGVFPSIEKTRAVYFELFRSVDFIKFSESEICLLFDTNDCETAVAKMSEYQKIFFVTFGKNGSLWCKNGTVKKVGAISVDCIDPTGAGDAFFAGVLSQLCGKREISDSDLDYAVRCGNVCGALTTLSRGTCDAVPSRQEVEKYLK